MAVIAWNQCAITALLAPGDEDLRAHRLWDSDLSTQGPYFAAEVADSDWSTAVLGNRLVDLPYPR